MTKITPEYWDKFVEEHDYVEKHFEVPDDDDLSGVGVNLSILKFEDIVDEAENAYPGIVVMKDGFIPVGSCLVGSGDPYFINVNDGMNGPLYRIYHDSVFDDGYDRSEAVVKVLEKYEELEKFEDKD